MVAVTPGEVRDRINISLAQAADAVVTKFIEDATETIELETGLTIDYTNCTSQEAVAIRNLAAIYCACRITGGSTSGLSYQIGDLQISNSSGANSGFASVNLQFLLDEAKRIIALLNKADFRAVNA